MMALSKLDESRRRRRLASGKVIRAYGRNRGFLIGRR